MASAPMQVAGPYVSVNVEAILRGVAAPAPQTFLGSGPYRFGICLMAIAGFSHYLDGLGQGT